MRSFFLRILCSAVFLVMLARVAAAEGPNLPPGTRFIMSHFGGNDGGGIEKLYISVSPDGVNWEALNGGNAVWEPAGWAPFGNVVRDPSIVYANGYYWVAYTSGNYGKGASFGLVKSTDLVNWTFVTNVSTAIPDATDPLTWGPFFFKDADGTVHLFVSISPINGSIYNPQPALRTHELHPLNADFTQWSAPVPVGLPSTNTNEFWVWREGDTYHGIYVDFQSFGRYYHVASTNLITGWQQPQLLGFGSLEGGFVLKKPEGGYRFYLEPGNGGQPAGYRYYDGSDQFTNFELGGFVNTATPMRNGKVIAAPETTSFEQWQTLKLPDQPAEMRGAVADPDRDGLPNLLEAATGFDPNVPEGNPIQTWFDSDGRLRLRHTRALSIADVNLQWQESGTLSGWQASGATVEIRSITLMSDGRELLEWKGPAPQAASPYFFRLRASMP
jgi:hypothetical protein